MPLLFLKDDVLGIQSIAGALSLLRILVALMNNSRDQATLMQFMMLDCLPIPTNAKHYLTSLVFPILVLHLNHFLSLVTKLLKNGQISFRLCTNSQIEIQSNQFFTINSCNIQTWSLFCIQLNSNDIQPFNAIKFFVMIMSPLKCAVLWLNRVCVSKVMQL